MIGYWAWHRLKWMDSTYIENKLTEHAFLHILMTKGRHILKINIKWEWKDKCPNHTFMNLTYKLQVHLLRIKGQMLVLRIDGQCIFWECIENECHTVVVNWPMIQNSFFYEFMYHTPVICHFCCKDRQSVMSLTLQSHKDSLWVCEARQGEVLNFFFLVKERQIVNAIVLIHSANRPHHKKWNKKPDTDKL